MKNITYVFFYFCIACSSHDKTEEKKVVVPATVITPDSEKKVLLVDEPIIDIVKYKQSVDSLLGNIIGKGTQTELAIDTLQIGDIIFAELETTPLANITNETQNIVKYSFLLPGKNNKLKHHFIALSFGTKEKADYNFAVFKKVATEKTGVPGLTYTSDYIVQVNKNIYWINSNCSYSYSNHTYFVDAFKKAASIFVEPAIKCECGQVKCFTE